MTKIALAVLHGIGKQDELFSEQFSYRIRKKFVENLPPFVQNPENELVIQPIFWGSVFQQKEEKIWKDLSSNGALHYSELRQFVIHFLGDAIAYQPSSMHNQNYEKVHHVYAQGLQELSSKAGADSPLFIAAHSLGSVITSNYFYDLQEIPDRLPPMIKEAALSSPIERGETLTGLFTLGSPLALWSLRYLDFDRPITVPSPHLKKHHPNLKGDWLNIYDQDDCFGFPLKPISPGYNSAVSQDMEINTGTFPSNLTPLSHLHYFTTDSIISLIATSLGNAWIRINL
ncbi:chemotaxis protein [Fictibacillus iocasae]|uniref:Chemotaxis protein n=1 Tax=Fictibacillus iocasae TaxID=2715437 RepID=A0ABW2NN33_9BACL